MQCLGCGALGSTGICSRPCGGAPVGSTDTLAAHGCLLALLAACLRSSLAASGFGFAENDGYGSEVWHAETIAHLSCLVPFVGAT